MDDCIFCEIAAGRGRATVVYEDDHTVAFMDINPASDGHVLVIPRRHARDVWDIPEAEAEAVMVAGVRVARKVKGALAPDGLNFWHASGSAAAQTVFHFHLHVIPRMQGAKLRVHGDHPGDPVRIAQIADLIRAHAG